MVRACALWVLGWCAALLLPAWGEAIWIEGENPSACSVPYGSSGWGRTAVLSEGRWLHLSLDAAKAAQETPEHGVLIAYAFRLTQGGTHEVWNRIGFEFVRAPFEWRVGASPWQRLEPTDFTTDLMEVARWCEVAWVRLGELQLPAGEHRLEIRIPTRHLGERRTILYASDAICISPPPFRPNGPHRPDAPWQTEQDRAAAAHVFRLESPTGDGSRTACDLAGTWQFARHDESQEVADRTGPLAAVPPAAALHWSSIAVPGDRNVLRPELAFCHRYLYRTRIHVPESHRGRRLFLDFGECGTFTTVFVNGRRMGFSDAVLCGFQADVTDAVRFGQDNEVWVGIKDAYYAIEPSAERPDVRQWFNTPLDLMEQNQGITNRFDYPVKGALANGITDRVRLISTAPALVEDVVLRPSVRGGALRVDAAVRNHGPAGQFALRVEIRALGSDAVVLQADAPPFALPSGGETTVDQRISWDDPVLWWPDAPHLYLATTILRRDRTAVDRVETRFGFREWGIDGTRFTLNGIPWQFRADLEYNDCAAGAALDAVARWRQTGQTMFRLRFQRAWGGMSRAAALGFFDEQGIPVRCNVGTFDGQHASYALARTLEQEGRRVKVPHPTLFANWRKQVAARVRRERNHPCIFAWELDNEIIYINARNFGNLETVEPEFVETARLVAALDDQGRGQLVAGGRALMDQALPINGCHYEAAADREYPDMAYGLGAWTEQTSHQPWPMALDRPIFLSEEYFAAGRNPPKMAGVGGEACFAGRSEAMPAYGLLGRMYSEGYRWQALGGFHFWCSRMGSDQYHHAWQPVVALCRNWNWTFAAGSRVERTVMVRNDTRYATPITLEWGFHCGSHPPQTGNQVLEIPPGQGQTLDLAFRTPPVTSRTQGDFHLVCSRQGAKVWEKRQPVHILGPSESLAPVAEAAALAVHDPSGEAAGRLRALGFAFTTLADPDEIPSDTRVLLIGRNALSPRQATDPAWQTRTAQGLRLVVLEQHHPLHYQAVPADVEPTPHNGRMAFMENPDHPVFAGLAQEDFACWSGDHIVYRHAYRKPSKGGRSLVQCDDELACSALVECAVGSGVMVLSQLAIGEKLPGDPVAQRLFDQMLAYAIAYRPVERQTAVALPDGDPRLELLAGAGLVFARVQDPLAAMRAGTPIVIADAAPGQLDLLAAGAEQVEAFMAAGGWLMLWGVTPESLPAFNRIVGVPHHLRPCRIEKVLLSVPRDPLAVGLSQRDVVLYSGRRIFPWQSIEYVADDLFSHVVDAGDDMAPFLTGPGIDYADVDRPSSLVNGFTDVEAWKYICYFDVPDRGNPPRLTWELPAEQSIVGFGIVPNVHYWITTRFRLIFDDDDANGLDFELAAGERGENPRQDFVVPPTRARRVTYVPLAWREEKPNPIVGIDNLWLKVERSPEFRERVRPLLDVGGLVRYPRGSGGIILNQVRGNPREAVPVNAEKKRTLVATVLRNLDAAFGGGDTASPGGRLVSLPVSLEGRCNLYLTSARGWPDRGTDLGHLPLGLQRFAGVDYAIRDFQTSPLESGITLDGMPGVKAEREVDGIAVGRAAEFICFLHTFFRRREWQPDPRRPSPPPVVFQYVIRYADGSEAEVDVRYGWGVEHWQQDAPKGLKDAALAWAAPFPGRAGGPEATVHSLQWRNPRPDVPVATIGLRYDKAVGNRYGAPVVLGISTAARME